MENFDAAKRRFRDSNGQTWDLTLNVGALKRCQELAGIDLAAKVEGGLFDELADDPIMLCNVLAAIVRPQMTMQSQTAARSMTDEDFAAALGGDVIYEAAQALIEAIVYFFRGRHGGIVAKIAAKRKSLQALTTKAVDAYIDSGEIEKKLTKVLAEQLGPQFGGVPAS